MKFRNIQKNDINQVLEIYNFHIKNGLANFEEKLLSNTKFSKIYNKHLNQNLPFIICEKNKKILGFAYLSNFRQKSGYRYTFEDSIYIDNKFIGQGIGSILLNELIKASSNNKDIKTIIAVIGGENVKSSIKIHKKNGFNIVGTLKKVGFKKNQWLDSIYMQKILNE